jgi:hypothetical protein
MKVKLRLLSLAASSLLGISSIAGCGTASSGNTVNAPQHQRRYRQFGTPAPPAVRRQILFVLEHYLAALADDSGPAACSFLYPPVAAELPAFKDPSGEAGCGPALGALFRGQSAAASDALRQTRPRQTLIKGSGAFAIVGVGGGTEAGFYPLEKDGDRWKVAALGVSILGREGRSP